MHEIFHHIQQIIFWKRTKNPFKMHQPFHNNTIKIPLNWLFCQLLMMNFQNFSKIRVMWQPFHTPRPGTFRRLYNRPILQVRWPTWIQPWWRHYFQLRQLQWPHRSRLPKRPWSTLQIRRGVRPKLPRQLFKCRLPCCTRPVICHYPISSNSTIYRRRRSRISCTWHIRLTRLNRRTVLR